jgi:hypothetical protein
MPECKFININKLARYELINTFANIHPSFEGRKSKIAGP